MSRDATATYRFRLDNLHCAACERRLRAVFADDARITRIDVDILAHTIALHASGAGLSRELSDRLADVGFIATPGITGADPAAVASCNAT